MPTVCIKKRKIHVGDKKIPLVSGEMHYWRLNPATWGECLTSIREMGIDIISTYIPWFYHEYKRGSFDFTGKTDPARDLVSFLELCKRKHFFVVIRPGPYIYSECPNDGVPDYAYKYHRLHPQFLKYASVYMKKVCSVLAPYQATKRGGHIILLQADNEIDPWPDVFGDQYGLGKKPGLFQKFIKLKYDGNIARLNEVWDSNYTSFDQTGPYAISTIKGDEALRRNLDYFEFKHYYSLTFAKWVIAEYKKYGITIPIYLNLYPFFYAHDWSAMQEVCDLTGIDLYPENELLVDRHDHRKMMDKIRYTRTFSTLPFIAEFASGVWHYRHYESGVLSPNHYRLLTLSAIAAGVCGWNWYMLVNRDNWYMSPINEWGRPRGELFAVFKDLVSIYRRIDPPQCKKLTNVAVTFNMLQYAAKTIPHDTSILTYLYDADIDYEFFDCRSGTIKKKILFYSGNQWISKNDEEHLLSYVQEGGILVCFRNFPRRDDYFKKLQKLQLADPTRVIFEFKKECEIALPGGEKTKTVSAIYSFDNTPGTKIYATIPNAEKHCIGYMKKQGKGTILHVGVEPSESLLFMLLDYFNIPLYVVSPTKNIHTTLLQRGTRYFLVIVNNGIEDKSATVIMKHAAFISKKFQVINIETGNKMIISGSKNPTFSVEISHKNGAVLELRVL